MSDYASMMGGGPSTVPTAAADPDGAFAYFFDGGDVFLDLGAQGDSFQGGGNLGDATIFAGSGADTVNGGAGDDFLFGGSENDAVYGAEGDDFLTGDAGNDSLQGGTGNDTVFGGAGNDRVDGGDGDDQVLGGEGADVVFSLDGDDTVFGGSGTDSVDGGIGNDLLIGGADADTLVGGADDDTLIGGSGSDEFYFFDGFGDDVISDLQAGDSIFLQPNINGSGLAAPGDLLNPSVASVTGGIENGVNFTLISIGGDTIRLQNVDVDDFTSNIASFVKIVP